MARATPPIPNLFRSPRGFLRHYVRAAATRARAVILPRKIEHLSGLREVPAAADEAILVCNIRDGRAYLDSFLAHYRALGIKHLVFLDNGSTDGTIERLKNEADVTVLRATVPFRDYKTLMKSYLIHRFGRGNWVLVVDMDELFDYPRRDQIPLRQLLGQLNRGGYTAVVAQMLDLFPKGSLGNQDAERWQVEHRYYDNRDLSPQDYVDFYEAMNVPPADAVKILWGGMRSKQFGARPLLSKHPLLRPSKRVKFLGPHNVSGTRVANFTGVLLHYKYVANFIEYMRRIAAEKSFHRGSAQYQQFLDVIEQDPELSLYTEGSSELVQIDQLVEEGFLVAPEVEGAG